MRKTFLASTAVMLAMNPAAFASKGGTNATSAPTPDPAAADVAAPATTETAETKAKSERVAPVLTDVFKIDLPARANKRGSTSAYPFHTLTEIGAAFGVKNKTASGLSSIVSNANRKAMEPMKDAAGNPMYETKELTGPDGNKVNVPDTDKPKMRATKHFTAVDVNDAIKAAIAGTPLEGSSVIVQRDA